MFKTYDSIPKATYDDLKKRIDKVIKYWDHQYQNVKGALRGDFKQKRDQYKNLLKRKLNKIDTF